MRFTAPGALAGCALSPAGDRVCCGDTGGNFYVLAPMGASDGASPPVTERGP
jgi:hypothetical protein